MFKKLTISNNKIKEIIKLKTKSKERIKKKNL